MNKRIKKKKIKQWIKNNVKITYSVERLDNGNCRLYANIVGIKNYYAAWNLISITKEEHNRLHDLHDRSLKT